MAATNSDIIDTLSPSQEAAKIHSQSDIFGTSSKDLFLDSLKSSGKYKYARYRGLPLRYAGWKSLGVGYIVEQLPDRLEKLVSPFMGGGQLKLHVLKNLTYRFMLTIFLIYLSTIGSSNCRRVIRFRID